MSHLHAVLGILRAVLACLRREKLLLLFPFAAAASLAVVPLALYLGLAGDWQLAIARFGPGFLAGVGVVAVAVTTYLGYVIVTFWSVALTRATLVALRGERPSFSDALSFALSRFASILGFAIAASTFGLLLSAIERRSFFVIRSFMATLGFAWTLVALMAMPVLVRERRGTQDSLRRSLVLLRGAWAEGEVTTLGLGLLWIPLLLVEAAGLPLSPGPALWIVAAFNSAVIAASWLCEHVYGAALYVYATEGVIPEVLQVDTLYAPRAPLPARKPAKIRAGLVVPVLALVGIAYFGMQTREAFKRTGLDMSDVSVADTAAWPSPWKPRWKVELPESARAMTTRGGELVVAGEHRFFKIDSQGAVTMLGEHGLSAPQAVAALAQGHAVLGRAAYGVHTLKVFRPDGKPLWWVFEPERILGFQQVAQSVAVASDQGLCLLDAAGNQRWCNSVSSLVAALDCDTDGVEDVLGNDATGQTVCYAQKDGKRVAVIATPRRALALAAHDLDDDGKKELLAVSSGFSDTVLSIWSSTGAARREVRLANVFAKEPTLIALRPRPSEPAHLVAALGEGASRAVFGVSLEAGWRLPLNNVHTVAGLEIDHAEALITAEDKTVTAWDYSSL